MVPLWRSLSLPGAVSSSTLAELFLHRYLPCQWSLDAESVSLCAAWSVRCVRQHCLLDVVFFDATALDWAWSATLWWWRLLTRLALGRSQVLYLYNSPPVCDTRQCIVDVGLGIFSGIILELHSCWMLARVRARSQATEFVRRSYRFSRCRRLLPYLTSV